MSAFALVLTGSPVPPAAIAVAATAIASVTQAPPTTLGPEQACEWLFEATAPHAQAARDVARAALAGMPVDVNLVATGETRRKRLLIADMDSTIIEQECIDEIADFAGYGAEVAAITERAMRGELDFEQALETRVGLLQGLATETLERVIRERLTIMPGAHQLVATMAENGAYCALVSGGFTFFTSRIAEQVGFHVNRANSLEIQNGALSGRVVPPILGRQAKLDALNQFSAERRLALSETLAVGDGANDLAMIKAAGLGVAYHAKPIVAAEADADIRHGDLSALLYLQGYHQTEFVC